MTPATSHVRENDKGSKGAMTAIVEAPEQSQSERGGVTGAVKVIEQWEGGREIAMCTVIFPIAKLNEGRVNEIGQKEKQS